MNFDTHVQHSLRRRRLLLPALSALAFAAVQPASAESLVPIPTRTVAAQHSPLPHGTEGSDELIVMLCRRGVEPGQFRQELPQELPLLCLVTKADEKTLLMGPARFQELLDKAASSGQLTVHVLRPK